MTLDELSQSDGQNLTPNLLWYTHKLFPPASVAIAALLGGFLGGALVLGINFHRMGRSLTGAASAAVGLILSAGLLVLPLYFLEDYGLMILAGHLLALPVCFITARRTQGAAIADHLLSQGSQVYTLLAAGIGAAALVAFLLAIFVVLTIRGPYWGEKIEIGSDIAIYYRRSVSRDEALKLANTLDLLGMFDRGHSKTVQLSKKGDLFVLSCVSDYKSGEERAVFHYYRRIGKLISEQVFDHQPVEVRLCDEQFQLRNVLYWVPE